jgi:hypothetical protein
MKSVTRTFTAAAFLVAAAPALGGPERDYNNPPPGSAPGDGKLWRELRHGTSWALWQLARVAQCSKRIRYGKYYESLDAAIQKETGPAASRAKDLRDKLTAAAEAAQKAIPPDGGRVHPCRVTLLDFDQRIDPRNKEVAKELPEFRAEAQRCADRMNQLLAAVTPSADVLERALDDIDVYLKRKVPPSPPGASSAEPPSKT